MSLLSQYDLSMLINGTLNRTLEEMDKQLEQIEDEDICKCEECVADMLCYCLNKLPPKYSVSLAQMLPDDNELEEKVPNLVAEAIRQISLNPAHKIQ